MNYNNEVQFWKSYTSQLCETWKQRKYLEHTGLLQDNYGFAIDLHGKSVLEVGSGPCGVVLRSGNGLRKVVEPAPYPNWVWERYAEQGVQVSHSRVEDMEESGWDEVWVFNVLQHVTDLEKAIYKIRNSAKVLRIFEFLDIPTDEYHTQTLTKKKLDDLFGINGTTVPIDEPYMYKAPAYCGVYELTHSTTTSLLIPKLEGNTIAPVREELFGTHLAMLDYMRAYYWNKIRVGAEIGTFAGQTAYALARGLCLRKLYLIDPYEESFGPDFSWRGIDAVGTMIQAKELLQPFSKIIEFVRLRSDQALEFFKKNNIMLDFVYIDGDHSEKILRADIEGYYPIVKYVIGGHDFLTPEGEDDWYSQMRDKVPDDNKDKDYLLRKYISVRYVVPEYARRYGHTLYRGNFSYADWWFDKGNV